MQSHLQNNRSNKFEGLIRVNDDNSTTGAGTIRDKTCVRNYIGSLSNGKYEGQGTLLLAPDDNSTEHYSGEFADGKFHGQGTLNKKEGN